MRFLNRLSVIFLLTLAVSIVGWGQSTKTKDDTAAKQGAQTWTGVLVDADCKATDKEGLCQLDENTKKYGLLTSNGKYARFEHKSETKVQAVLLTAKSKTGQIRVNVTGRMAGDHIEIDTIEVVQ